MLVVSFFGFSFEVCLAGGGSISPGDIQCGVDVTAGFAILHRRELLETPSASLEPDGVNEIAKGRNVLGRARDLHQPAESSVSCGNILMDQRNG
jgi:hypothetical protein